MEVVHYQARKYSSTDLVIPCEHSYCLCLVCYPFRLGFHQSFRSFEAFWNVCRYSFHHWYNFEFFQVERELKRIWNEAVPIRLPQRAFCGWLHCLSTRSHYFGDQIQCRQACKICTLEQILCSVEFAIWKDFDELAWVHTAKSRRICWFHPVRVWCSSLHAYYGNYMDRNRLKRWRLG